MNSNALNQLRHPWRWSAVFIGILATQTALLFVFSSDTRPSPTPAPPSGLIEIILDAATNRWLSQQVWLEDPAQFALLSARGFSANAWFRLPRFDPGVQTRTEPPMFLANDPAGLGLAPAATPPSASWRGPLAPTPLPPMLPPSNSLPLQTQSAIRIEGGLAGRPLLTPFALPSWEHVDVLQPATVQVLVDRSGAVLSSTLLTPSGLPAADRHALDVARAARFGTPPNATYQPDLTWGRLVFLWHARAPTNAPASPPQ